MITLSNVGFPEGTRYLLVSVSPDVRDGVQKHEKASGSPLLRLSVLVSTPVSYKPETVTVKLASDKDLTRLPVMTPFAGFTGLTGILYDLGSGKNNGLSMRATGMVSGDGNEK